MIDKLGVKNREPKSKPAMKSVERLEDVREGDAALANVGDERWKIENIEGSLVTVSTPDGSLLEASLMQAGTNFTLSFGTNGNVVTIHRTDHGKPELTFFHYAHLPEHLQAISSPFHMLAEEVIENIGPGPQRSIALQKLIEAKDAAVRAFAHPGC